MTALSINSYYNDPVFRDDILLLLRDGGFITLSEEEENRIFARQSYDADEMKNIWCGKYKNAEDSELIISYTDKPEFSLVTYDNGLKTSLVGGKLTIENKQTAVFTSSAPKGEYKITMFIYENGIFVSENEVPSPYGHGQSVAGYYKKIE